MKTNGKFLTAPVTALALGAAASVQAAVYTLPDVVRPANGGSVTTSFDFVPAVPPTSWTGSPAATISNQSALYLTATVSWGAVSSIANLGVQFYGNAGGGAPRAGVGFVSNEIRAIGGQNYAATDPDGAGPATAGPGSGPAVNPLTITTINLVMRIDQAKLNAITPIADPWYTNTSQQDNASIFMWINPDFGINENLQSTGIAFWRSGQGTFRGVTIFTGNTNSEITFSNLAVYTDGDSPFAPIPEPSAALLGGLGLLALLRRRRDA
jgi:MYXO-CTERM domain-containing protein